MTDDADWPCCTTPLTATAGPDEIRAALLPEYRGKFDRDLAAAQAHERDMTLRRWILMAVPSG